LKEIPDCQNRLKDYPHFGEEVVINDLGLPMGKSVPNWQPPSPPPRAPMLGQSCRLEPLSSQHIRQLWESFSVDKKAEDWAYVGIGPYDDFETFEKDFVSLIEAKAAMFHAVVDLRTEKAVGTASYRSINCDFGSIEIGGLFFSTLMQRTTLSTETIVLMMRRAFELGYRRFEWRCNTLNSRSVSAAIRYGCSFEGIFRNDMIARGCNRDTAWFSITDEEWPSLNRVYQSWLDIVSRNEHKSLSSMVALVKQSNAK
jgi:RimJ/RimL family protein N-acetyltransferase